MADKTDFNDFAPEVGGEAIKEKIEGAEAVRETDAEAIARLAALSPMEYDRVREEEADKLDIRVTTLDKEIAKVRGETVESNGSGRPLDVRDLEPWPETVKGEDLVDEIAARLQLHVTLPEHADAMITLWTVHTYAYDLGNISPLLGIVSPQKRCGKTTLMELLNGLVNRPLAASNISPSAIFRTIEKAKPTLLIDEADSFLKNNEELRGVLNSGHTRAMAFVIRTVGEDYEPRQFSTWAPKAVALIGRLPDTLHDRAVIVSMRRKLPHEPTASLKGFDGETLRRKCARWVADNASKIEAHVPKMPEGVFDRLADNWEPLLTIADLAGGRWPDLARAALTASLSSDDDESAAAMLLADIKTVFADKHATRLSTATLIEALAGMEDRPWPEWNKGKPITGAGLARLLKPFGIRPKKFKEFNGKGYELETFNDSLSRYLPNRNETPKPPRNGAGSSETRTETKENEVSFVDISKPASDKEGFGVSFQKGETHAFRGGEGGRVYEAILQLNGRPVDGLRLAELLGRSVESITSHLDDLASRGVIQPRGVSWLTSPVVLRQAAEGLK